MQQYFANVPLKTGGDYVFTKEQAHHAADVLHMDHERIRLVYNERGYFAETFYDRGILKAHILEEDKETNELNADIRLVMGMIRREKFELVLQKAAELGVCEIVPLVCERSIIQLKPEKKERIMNRWQAILQEASEQCKRSRIPRLSDVHKLNELGAYQSELNIVPYEKTNDHDPYISELYQKQRTVTAVIGPEGGFSEPEIQLLKSYGYVPVTLGSRILRAETAAVYACSVLAECAGRDARQ